MFLWHKTYFAIFYAFFLCTLCMLVCHVAVYVLSGSRILLCCIFICTIKAHTFSCLCFVHSCGFCLFVCFLLICWLFSWLYFFTITAFSIRVNLECSNSDLLYKCNILLISLQHKKCALVKIRSKQFLLTRHFH